MGVNFELEGEKRELTTFGKRGEKEGGGIYINLKGIGYVREGERFTLLRFIREKRGSRQPRGKDESGRRFGGCTERMAFAKLGKVGSRMLVGGNGGEEWVLERGKNNSVTSSQSLAVFDPIRVKCKVHLFFG